MLACKRLCDCKAAINQAQNVLCVCMGGSKYSWGDHPRSGVPPPSRCRQKQLHTRMHCYLVMTTKQNVQPKTVGPKDLHILRAQSERPQNPDCMCPRPRDGGSCRPTTGHPERPAPKPLMPHHPSTSTIHQRCYSATSRRRRALCHDHQHTHDPLVPSHPGSSPDP